MTSDDLMDARVLESDSKVIEWLSVGESLRLARRRCPGCEADWWAPTEFADWIAWL